MPRWPRRPKAVLTFVRNNAVSRTREVSIPLYSISIDEATPQVLCSVLGPSLQERHWGPGSRPEKGNRVVKDLGHNIMGVSEGAGIVQSGGDSKETSFLCTTT